VQKIFASAIYISCNIGISEMKLGLRSWLIKPCLDKLQALEDEVKTLNEKVQLPLSMKIH